MKPLKDPPHIEDPIATPFEHLEPIVETFDEPACLSII
jgi:hypothetical protein